MKAERNVASNTLRGTLLLRMANSRTLAKHRVHHPEGSLPSSRKKVFRLSKNEKSGPKASEGSCPLRTILAFFLEIWERESAPADYCLIVRLAPAPVFRSNSPSNKPLTDSRRSRPRAAPAGYHFIPWSMAVVFIIGKLFDGSFRSSFRRKLLCIRQDHVRCQEKFCWRQQLTGCRRSSLTGGGCGLSGAF
jgi:hypothetical protein